MIHLTLRRPQPAMPRQSDDRRRPDTGTSTRRLDRPHTGAPTMFRIRSLSLIALMLVAGVTAAQAQIPGSFSPTPSASITLQAQKSESFAMTLSSTVQSSALAVADSTAGASQA